MSNFDPDSVIPEAWAMGCARLIHREQLKLLTGLCGATSRGEFYAERSILTIARLIQYSHDHPDQAAAKAGKL